MHKTRTRLWLFIVTIAAFFVPFGAIIAVEHAKNSAKIASEQQDYLASQASTDAARVQYYQNIAAHKDGLKQAMSDASAQYQTLLDNQTTAVAAHQKNVTQTTLQPVTVQKIIQPSTSSSSSSNKPKSSRKTKTS